MAVESSDIGRLFAFHFHPRPESKASTRRPVFHPFADHFGERERRVLPARSVSEEGVSLHLQGQASAAFNAVQAFGKEYAEAAKEFLIRVRQTMYCTPIDLLITLCSPREGTRNPNDIGSNPLAFRVLPTPLNQHFFRPSIINL